VAELFIILHVCCLFGKVAFLFILLEEICWPEEL